MAQTADPHILSVIQWIRTQHAWAAVTASTACKQLTPQIPRHADVEAAAEWLPLRQLDHQNL
ncbi:hypothetical protein CROQUDRAFT_95066 [Cronartium quercuum f. sp. fusiforme G11]|uniref:Uncharacterized protein n=1 Tax=Cronartium quercuum f. sp. fusiforme G11 TaxID=708437 RepID=A0A9P6T9S7_9BASI|nr:hypothetical protein CROQUDRAFT_95066 [Cronartium quercuum f. sp. fusiforme G11]